MSQEKQLVQVDIEEFMRWYAELRQQAIDEASRARCVIERDSSNMRPHRPMPSAKDDPEFAAYLDRRIAEHRLNPEYGILERMLQAKKAEG